MRSNESSCEIWLQHFTKVKGIFTQTDDMYSQLKSDIRQFSNNLISLSFLNKASSNFGMERNHQEASFMYSQLIKSVFIEMKNEQDRKRRILHEVAYENRFDPTFYPEYITRVGRLGQLPVEEVYTLVEFFREQYKGNACQLALISEFEKNYHPDQSIWWYTRPTFLYEILNKALRVQDVFILYRLRFYIVDLHRKLLELHQQASHIPIFVVYRGQGMSYEELEKLKQNCGGLLSVNSFLSTTTDRQVALGFAMGNIDRNGFVAILFEVFIDHITTSRTPFADIHNESYFRDAFTEDEILFSIGAIFRIHSVDQMDNGVWKVVLTLADADDKELNELTAKQHYLCKQLGDTRALGYILFEMGNFHGAKYFFQLQLDELLAHTNEKSFKNFVTKTAASCKALGIDFPADIDYQESCQMDQKQIAALYNDLGLTSYEQYDYERALFYYQKALNVEIDDSSFSIKVNPIVHINIALVYSDRKNYDAAIKEKHTARIMMESDPSTDPMHLINLSRLYYNIGSHYYSVKNFRESLIWANKGLKLQLAYLPPIHPYIGKSYELIARALGLGAILEKKSTNQEPLGLSMQYMIKANYILKRTLPSNHRDMVTNQEDFDLLKAFAENRAQLKRK